MILIVQYIVGFTNKGNKLVCLNKSWIHLMIDMNWEMADYDQGSNYDIN